MKTKLLTTFILVFSLSYAISQCPTNAGAAITSLPFIQTGLNTSTAGNVFSSGDGCTSLYMSGDDYTFTYTPTLDECIEIALTNTATYVGLFITDGCPNVASTCCIASTEESGGNPSISSVSLVGGTTYHFTISTWASPQSTPFDISITSRVCRIAPTPGNCTDMTINTTNYSQAGLTTCGFGDDFDNGDACSNYYMNGEDIVIEYIPTTSECVSISLSNTTTWVGLFVLDACAFDAGANCLTSNTSSGGNPSIEQFDVIAGTSYFIHISTNPNPQCTPFDLDISACPPVSPCGNLANNDFCSTPTTLIQDTGGSVNITNNGYTADETQIQNAEFCGTIENNSWYIFTALSTTETFDFSNITGATCGSGIQVSVFEVSTDTDGCCTSFTTLSNCYSPNNQADGTVTASPLVIGNQYYLMIDGNAGSGCNYKINNWSLNSVLAVELKDFYAVNNENENKLVWTTASEINNDYFLIQKSADGKIFNDVATIKGHGNSNAPIEYDFTDHASSLSSLTYYRLKQFDYDGKYAFSKVVAIESVNKQEVKVFPNPFTNQFSIEIKDAEVKEVQIELVNHFGELAYAKSIFLENRKATLNMGNSIPPGIYFIKIYAREGIIIEKIIRGE